MSATTTIACGICERPIANAPADAGPVLCPLCAANPGLVRAFREGLARNPRVKSLGAWAEPDA